MSNFRISNSVRYTTTFTPSTIDLTNDANTKLLTLNRNRPLDLSSSARVVTPIGGVKTTNFSPFISTAVWSSSAHGGSAYFDGSGDYLGVADNEAFNYGSGDFTLECWIYLTTTLDSKILTAHTSDGNYGPVNLWFSSGTLQLYSSSSGSSFDVASGATVGTPTVGSWNHVAVSRQGTSIRCFLNGVLGSTTTTSATLMNSTGTFQIGYRSSSEFYTGYISNFRVVKGTAVYTSAFTPPTSPVTAIANTSLLTDFTNGAIVDSSTRNVLETVGNTQVSTSVVKYGTGSLYFDGTGDYLKLNPSPILNFGTGDFTIEFWAYRTSTSAQFPFTQSNIGSGGRSGVAIGWDGSNRFWWLFGDNTDWVFERFAGTTPSINTWFHVAVVRDSGTARLYLNGVQIDSVSNSTNLSQTSNISYIGGNIDGFGVNGYLDDFRITDGFSRYSNGTTFTPPVSAFPRR
jgi:hypothetical protein